MGLTDIGLVYNDRQAFHIGQRCLALLAALLVLRVTLALVARPGPRDEETNPGDADWEQADVVVAPPFVRPEPFHQ